MAKPFQVSLAPQELWPAINPWTFYQQGAQFGFVNFELSQTPPPEVERAILRGQLAEIRQVKHTAQSGGSSGGGG